MDELKALRVQEWLQSEHDLLVPVQHIEEAMRAPCSCPFVEAHFTSDAAQVAAARGLAERWNADARAEGFGGGAVKARDLLEVMDAALPRLPGTQTIG